MLPSAAMFDNRNVDKNNTKSFVRSLSVLALSLFLELPTFLITHRRSGVIILRFGTILLYTCMLSGHNVCASYSWIKLTIIHSSCFVPSTSIRITNGMYVLFNTFYVQITYIYTIRLNLITCRFYREQINLKKKRF